MESLKRFYLNLVAGFTVLAHDRTETVRAEDGLAISNRVSRVVDHYRTHFFNL